jgi:hypothetical protein
MCGPLSDNDPVWRQRISDFASALTLQLMRPPRDPRLNRRDTLTVLPAELQIVGVTLESLGSQYLSVEGLAAAGGKAGLLRKYVDKATGYVFRRTGVDHDDALLILRQLITSAHTKRDRSALEIQNHISALSAEQIGSVLAAFAEISITKRLPTSQTSSPSYELMHDHLVSVLLDAPAPILIRARDAEESFRFWRERDSAQVASGVASTSSSWPHDLRHLLRQPMPVLQAIRLWRFALLENDKRLLQRSIRGFVLKLLIVVIGSGSLWLGMRSNTFQIWRISGDARVTEVAAAANVSGTVRASRSTREWIEGTEDLVVLQNWALANVSAGNTDKAIISADSMRDPYLQSRLLLAVASQCKTSNDRSCVNRCVTEARAAMINEPSLPLRSIVWAQLALVYAALDPVREAEAVNEAVKVGGTNSIDAAAETGRFLYAAGATDQARRLWAECLSSWLGKKDPFVFDIRATISSMARAHAQVDDDLILQTAKDTEPLFRSDLLGEATIDLADYGDTSGIMMLQRYTLANEAETSPTLFARVLLADKSLNIEVDEADAASYAVLDGLSLGTTPAAQAAVLVMAGQREAARAVAMKLDRSESLSSYLGDKRPRFSEFVELLLKLLDDQPEAALKLLERLRDAPDGPPYTQWRETVRLVAADQLAEQGKTQSALSVVRGIPVGDYQALALSLVAAKIGRHLIASPEPISISDKESKLSEMVVEAEKIGDYNLKSAALGQLGIAYAQLGDYRSARRLAATCLPPDELRIYTAVLNRSAGSSADPERPSLVVPNGVLEKPRIAFDARLTQRMETSAGIATAILGN